ncbi:hypothetical protein OE88DRAFT_194915 [Heliocybe sulcata]|uniref:Uncharacterized protein n=1 Tax=Heliocybe sulcata TaxID=5364 RepID=A0A5C3N0D1_9AGAM|nr:hypothetical protein OE88DRAFT_194915 [Heliocybe sulcata]
MSSAPEHIEEVCLGSKAKCPRCIDKRDSCSREWKRSQRDVQPRRRAVRRGSDRDPRRRARQQGAGDVEEAFQSLVSERYVCTSQRHLHHALTPPLPSQPIEPATESSSNSVSNTARLSRIASKSNVYQSRMHVRLPLYLHSTSYIPSLDCKQQSRLLRLAARRSRRRRGQRAHHADANHHRAQHANQIRRRDPRALHVALPLQLAHPHPALGRARHRRLRPAGDRPRGGGSRRGTELEYVDGVRAAAA